MAGKPKQLILLLIIFCSLILSACSSATATNTPPPTATTDVVTVAPQTVIPSAAATATTQPSATVAPTTVNVATVPPLTGAPTANLPNNTPTKAPPPNDTTAPPPPTGTTVAVDATPARTATATNTPSPRLPTPSVRPVASPSVLNPNGTVAIVSNGDVALMSLPSLSKSPVSSSKVLDVAWSGDGQTLVVLDDNGQQLMIAQGTSWNDTRTVKLDETVQRVLVSQNGNYAATLRTTAAGWQGRILDLKSGNVLSSSIAIGGLGDNIAASWDNSGQNFAFSAPLLGNSVNDLPAPPDMTLLNISDGKIKSTTFKAVDQLEAGLGFRFVRWDGDMMLATKVDLRVETGGAVRGYISITRDGKVSSLPASDNRLNRDENTLRMIPEELVATAQKKGLRLTYAPDERFAAFSAYDNTTKTNRIYLVSLSGSEMGQVQPIATGTSVVWQPIRKS